MCQSGAGCRWVLRLAPVGVGNMEVEVEVGGETKGVTRKHAKHDTDGVVLDRPSERS